MGQYTLIALVKSVSAYTVEQAVVKIETLFVQLQHNLVKAIPGDIAFDTTEANIVQAVHSNTNATNAIPTIQSSAAPRATSLKTEKSQQHPS